jgi:hypothetical protein
MGEDWILRVGDKDEPGGPQHVHGAQWLMKGHNQYGIVWYTGQIDGDFGAASGAAARQCKFDLGYGMPSVQPTFGLQLKAYLTGAKKRTPAMVARAKQRAKKYIWPTRPHGTVIGFPGIGTHSFVVPPNNWESDNAWDIAVPQKSKAVAVAAGVIGKQFGPLPDPDPRYHGIRLHLVTSDNEFYYAHLLSTFPGIGPGVTVKQGDILGATGFANNVDHLHIAVKHLIKLADL